MRTDFNLAELSFFIFFLFDLFATLVLITFQCSRIVRKNVIIYKTNQAFCYTFGRFANVHVGQRLKVWFLERK